MASGNTKKNVRSFASTPYLEVGNLGEDLCLDVLPNLHTRVIELDPTVPAELSLRKGYLGTGEKNEQSPVLFSVSRNILYPGNLSSDSIHSLLLKAIAKAFVAGSAIYIR
ncbi:hypothetical protein Hte_010452 [Hypoxylon texense]